MHSPLRSCDPDWKTKKTSCSSVIKKTSLHSKKCVFTHSIITWDSKKLYIDWKLESWVSKKRAEFFVLWYFIWIDNEFQLSAVELTMQNLWCYEAFLNYATIAKYVCLCWPPKNWNLNHDEVVLACMALGSLGQLADWASFWQTRWLAGRQPGQLGSPDGKRLWVDSTDRESVCTHIFVAICACTVK